MPLIIDSAGTENNSLPVVQTLPERIAAIPGLHGAFDPAVLTQGAAVDLWPASHGTGALVQANAANRPVRSVLNGLPVVSNMDATDGLWADGTWPLTGAQLTIGLRIYLADHTIDQQYVFGAHTTFRMIWRAQAWNWFLLNTPGGNITIALDPATASGWHTVIVSQGASTVSATVDDVEQRVNNPGGATLFSAPVLGNTATGAASTAALGLRGSIGRVLLAQSGTHDTPHHATVREWLEG